MKRIPLLLIYLRLVLGFLMIALSIHPLQHFTFIVISLLSIGLLSDIFDGIIARKLKVSTPSLRRLDSTIDQVFFVCTAISCYLHCADFFRQNGFQLMVLIGTEVAVYILCFVKFKKEIATHSIGAKIWTLLLFATLVQLFADCSAGIVFQLCFWLGILTRIEIALIIFILKEWTHDVPTFVHAIRIRKGLPIKRNKLFNG